MRLIHNTMGNRNLYLVGTVHIDLDGRERLDTLLDRLSPSVVALEFHKDREDLGALRKSPEEEQREINAMIDESGLNLNPRQRATLIESGHRINEIMGYEFKSSRDYI
jgi:pheromone shutdown protein TraB